MQARDLLALCDELLIEARGLGVLDSPELAQAGSDSLRERLIKTKLAQSALLRAPE